MCVKSFSQPAQFAQMVKRTPRKRNAAEAEAALVEKASGEDETEGEQSLETEEEKGANVIEENPLFEEEQGEEEAPMEIASVETVADAVDEDEPVAKKSKQENDESKILKENVQPEKLKVIELRNALKVYCVIVASGLNDVLNFSDRIEGWTRGE